MPRKRAIDNLEGGPQPTPATGPGAALAVVQEGVDPRMRAARRVLVVTKPRYIGDTIVATPFLRRLAEALPDADVTLLAGAAAPTVLEGCPWVERVWSMPAGGLGVRDSARLVRRIREAEFDAALLLNRSMRMGLVVAAAGVPLRVGFDTEHRGCLLTVRVPYDWGKPDRDCALDLLRAVGISADAAQPELWVSGAERAAAGTLLAEHGVLTGTLLVGMQPGAHDPQVREWGAERFAAVADLLFSRTGARTVLLGSADEAAVSRRVADAMRSQPIVLTGRTNLREALAVITRCSLWIGNDGGLLHAAVALGPATVGVFGPTKAARWGYGGTRNRTMVTYPASGRSDPKTIRRCLDAISPEAVAEQALALMEVSQRVA